ncbi:MAG: hypothetical protein WCL23_04360 [Candidatus Moraniibacteriota bacterium]
MAKKSNSIDWVAVQKNELEAILNIPEVVSELHDVIMSGGKYRDPYHDMVMVGGHVPIGRLRQCERVVLTVLACHMDTYPNLDDRVMEMLDRSAFNSMKIRFDPHQRYDLSSECGFLVTKRTASPRDLQFGENEALRKLVYVSDGILDMQDLRAYIEQNHQWIINPFSELKGEDFIEPEQEVSDGETVLGSMSPDAKNLFTLLRKFQLCFKKGVRLSGIVTVLNDLEDALRECLELAWGKGGTYAVRKGYLVVSL